MVRTALLRLAALLALLAAAPAAAAETLPPFAVQDADGRHLGLDDFRGRVVLLDFWASWCAPCVAEMPALERLHRTYAERGLAVAAVSIDKGGLPKVQLFYRLNKLSELPIFLDPGREAAQALGVVHVPTSFLIGRDGRVLARFDGPHDWEADTALIEKALAER